MGDKFLHPIREGFRLLSVGPTKGYALVKEGKLTIIKVGHKSMLADSEIKAFVSSLMDEARSKKAA